MKQGIMEFNSIVKQFGFSCKKRKLEDGLWLNYAEKPMGTWSKIIKFFDSPDQPSITAGLEVPKIDLVMDLLFPQAYPRKNMEYRILKITAEPTNEFSLESWLYNKIQVCNFGLERIKKPGDLAIYFASLESRKHTPRVGWNDVCRYWTAITYLGKGKAAAITAINEEIRYAEKFEITTALDYLFQIIFLKRKPRNLHGLAKDLTKALANLRRIEELGEYSTEDFSFPEIYPER